MTKLSLLAPLLTGISALSLLINSPLFGSGEKRKSATGVIVKAGPREILLKGDKETFAFSLTPETRLHLNERLIDVTQIENGRKATVVFAKAKSSLVAQSVDLFPVPDDFERRA